MDFIKRQWLNNYKVKLNIPEATLVVLESATDCSKLALRNQGTVYASKLNEGVLLCCKCVSKYKNSSIVLFIQLVDDCIKLHCSAHKKRWFSYSDVGQIFSAFGVEQEDIEELKPHYNLITKVVLQETATDDEINQLFEAINVVMSLAFCVDFSAFQ